MSTSKLLAVTLVAAAVIAIAVALLVVNSAELRPAKTSENLTHVAEEERGEAVLQPTSRIGVGKVTICIRAGNKTVCADPATVNLVRVAVAQLLKTARYCRGVDVVMANNKTVDLCNVNPLALIGIRLVLGLTNITEATIYDYNITGVKLVELSPSNWLDSTHAVVFEYSPEVNMTFNEVGVFVLMRNVPYPVMIAHWVLPQNITVAANDILVVSVNFTGLAGFVYKLLRSYREWRDYYDRGPAEGVFISLVDSAQQTYTLEYLYYTWYYANYYRAEAPYTAVSTCSNTTCMLSVLVLHTRPFNITQVVLYAGTWDRDNKVWVRPYMAVRLSVNATSATLGAGTYGLILKFAFSLT